MNSVIFETVKDTSKAKEEDIKAPANMLMRGTVMTVMLPTLSPKQWQLWIKDKDLTMVVPSLILHNMTATI